VDGSEVASKLLQDGYGGRLIIYEDSPLTASEDLAAQNQRLVCDIEPVVLENSSDCLLRHRIGLKNRGHDSALSPGPHDVRPSFFTQEQSKCVNQNRFSSAGFAGEKVQSGGELDRCAFNNGVVFEPQFGQQRSVLVSRVERRIARYPVTPKR